MHYVFVAIPCREYYPNRIKNLECKSKIPFTLWSNLWLSLAVTIFMGLATVQRHYEEISYAKYHPPVNKY